MPPREPALQLIIGYKLVRAAVALVAGLTFLALAFTPFDQVLRDLASRLSVVAAGLATALEWAAAPGHLAALGALLTLDGLVTLVEGWALLRGWRWGVWLVVFASGLFLPFEVAAIAERATVLRVCALVVNLAIVGWLLRARVLRAPELKVERAL